MLVRKLLGSAQVSLFLLCLQGAEHLVQCTHGENSHSSLCITWDRQERSWGTQERSLALEGALGSWNGLLSPRQITLLQRLGDTLKGEEGVVWQSMGVSYCFKQRLLFTLLILSWIYSARGVSLWPPELWLSTLWHPMSLGERAVTQPCMASHVRGLVLERQIQCRDPFETAYADTGNKWYGYSTYHSKTKSKTEKQLSLRNKLDQRLEHLFFSVCLISRIFFSPSMD